MTTSNGDRDERKDPLELNETLTIETSDGEQLGFEVVGILEDSENGTSYAVLRHEDPQEEEDQFIVTDLEGTLIEDDEFAQTIVNEFLAFAQEEDDRAAHNGDTG